MTLIADIKLFFFNVFSLIFALRLRAKGKFYSLFFRKAGKNFLIDRSVLIKGMNNIEVGDNIWIGFGCVLNGTGGIKIGNNVLIAQGVKIYSENHDYRDRDVDIMFQDGIRKPVYIEDGAWLCANCVILPGVRVGKHAVVAAGGVVTKDVPPYTVYGGVPAKFIKSI